MFERRLHVLLIVLTIVCCALVLRSFSLQVVGQAKWTKQSEDALTDEREIPTVRGRILDVKGRELAVDQPCIDACVQYYAIAASHDTKWAPNTDEGKWLNSIARGRLRKRLENYADLPLSQRKTLLAAEAQQVKADIDTMWHELAILSKQTDEQMDEIRRQIVRRVETRRRLLWYRKYNDADKTARQPSFWSRLLGAGPAELDSFDVHVSEERDAHIILPNIDYGLRNELARRAGNYPGLLLREGVIRLYPQKEAACQTIGRVAKVMSEDLVADPRRDEKLVKYTATDDIGREGLEKLLEPQLRGTRGLETTGDTDDESSAQISDPVPGQDVYTTLDIELQKKVEAAFETVMFQAGAPVPKTEMPMPGAAVVIDVATGEIRAMASYPTYDLNRFDEDYPRLIRDQINRPMLNRATMLPAEPGSTVKPIVGITAITDGVFGLHDTIHCDGFLVLDGVTIKKWGRCWTARIKGGPFTHHTLEYPHPTDDLTFPDALQRSCNVFHEELAARLGMDRLTEGFKKFGLGAPVGVGLPEYAGTLPDEWQGPAHERIGVLCSAGIGESYVEATPLQMANVAAIIARGGIGLRPTLKAGEARDHVDLHLNQGALAEARQGMDEVVNSDAGTGRQARLEDVMVAAKTGSAQTRPLRPFLRDDVNLMRLKDENGKFMHDEVAIGTHDSPNPRAPWYRYIGSDEKTLPAHGWMIGFAPVDHPTVAFAVLVEYGGGGGPAAGSVVRKLVEACKDEGYVAGR
ncbi:MAG: spoVD [Phycisphaerales bacterium]|nr:spoVD [Phycisphaerales bacterium]